MSQTTTSAGGQPVGFAGMVADSGEGHDIVSGFSLDPNQVPFGYGLTNKVAQDGYFLPSGASGTLEVAGINVWAANHMPAITLGNGQVIGDLGASGLLTNSSLQVGRRGRFLVPVESNVVINDRAFCRTVATGSLTIGSWIGTNLGGSYVRDCTAQGIFRSNTFTATDGTTKVAILECDFTNKPA